MRLQVWSLALPSGSRIRYCCELWCRLQTQLGSCIAVALAKARSYSSDLTSSLGKNFHILHVQPLKARKTKPCCRSSPVAYGDSQARGLIRAVAAGLRQSHSNTGSEPRLQPTPSSRQRRIINPLSKGRDRTRNLMVPRDRKSVV